MQRTLHIGLVQYDPTVGDVDGNVERIERRYAELAARADLVVAPELSVLGYPPRDLLHRTGLLDAQWAAVEALAGRTVDGPPLIVGAPVRRAAGIGPPLQNGAVVLRDGEVAATYAKRLLPTYDVFDEHRYFEPGTEPVTVTIDGIGIGLSICEDAWHDAVITGQRRHDTNPLADLADRGADVIVTLSASPFSLDKPNRRDRRFADHAARTGCPVAFVNQVGGNDELIFDGNSFVVGADGDVVARLAGFEPDAGVVEVPVGDADPGAAGDSSPPTGDHATQARRALRLGISDYFEKVGFDEAIVGMSGGIDSSVAAALAVDALGSDGVYGVSLPSSVTSEESVADARAVAERLGIEFDAVPIGETTAAVRAAFENHAGTGLTGIARENLQARVRGAILMGFANERDALVLTPDNKSEAAVGYCTLYGDTVGALAPLGDCYKGLVYDLAAQYNDDPPGSASGPVIPDRVIQKAPSAELREGQTDADELPPYDQLDPVLAEYVPGQATGEELREEFPAGVVDETLERLTRAEFKRRQTPPPLRITRKAFGRGWNYPVAADYRHVRE
ncbi:MAG: NAD+ synthase [Salinirussus sp.]